MSGFDITLIIMLAVSIVISIFTVTRFASVRKEINQYRTETSHNINDAFSSFGNMVFNNQKSATEAQDKRLAELNEKFNQMSLENEQKLENIRSTMSQKIGELTEDNNRQLEKMRNTVDEKLQKTLEERIGQSFRTVSERLEQVSKGLGEMQTLATGVGDLKKVLSNVKTRGILGEVQLGAILEEILAPEQYAENVNTRGEGSNVVEFAVKLPGENGKSVWLPIDSKFPGDAYAKLVDAYDVGDVDIINAAQKNLVTMIKNEAKDIKTKYIAPPNTTNFGIMFLPFEGLYAEVVRLGMVETLQHDYNVNIAGPTTMAALLNSLQMGFRTLAIQKRSSEVWDVLGAVKTEFGKFEDVLVKAQNNLNQANNNLDTLIGTRTRVMQRKLKSVTELSGDQAAEMFDFNSLEDGETDEDSE
ncbi:DNA recombination protein RmuC [Aminicella lysinilytica]|uniref:DNA recombination protein RmuC n=1 Tax=Aminicella lysinilytica TaxID=433323 RepID=A0A4R6Q971_9FIRM|nr:DNA recombination protein RmuC [Aminicella lysinilytica]TDP58406.1 DNA recombination protein RmuC [Aminicella lysinilytica]